MRVLPHGALRMPFVHGTHSLQIVDARNPAVGIDCEGLPGSSATSMPSATDWQNENTSNRQIIPVIGRCLVDDCQFFLGVARPSVNAETTLFRVRIEAGHEQ